MQLIVCTAVVFASLFILLCICFLLQFKFFFVCLLQLKYLVTVEMFFVIVVVLFCFSAWPSRSTLFSFAISVRPCSLFS